MANEHNNVPAVPQGWKLVPVEPTEAMSIAGGIAWESSLADDFIGPLEDAWAAMLAATPAPAPAPAVPDGLQWFTVAEHGIPEVGAEVIGGLWYTDPWLKPEFATTFMWGQCRVVESKHRDFKDGKQWHTFGPSHNQITHWARINNPGQAATPAPAPADGRGTDAQIQVERDIARHAIVGALAAGYAGQAHPGADHWLAAAHDAGVRIKSLEAPAPEQEVQSDPNGWCEYVAGMVFGWLQMTKELPEEDRSVAAIAGIIRRRLWAYKPAQEVTLTDEERQQVFKAAENRMVREINLSWRTAVVDEVIAALRAKGGK